MKGTAMPLESPLPPVADRVAELNARYRHHAATAVLEHALADPMVGRVAMVSSFGAESVVLLHLVSVIDRTVPVVFIDTRMLFAETLAYQGEVAEKLGLAEVRTIRPDPVAVLARDVDNLLYQVDPDGCCALRKGEPMERALRGFDAWINGRKRYQGQTRAAIDFFEAEGNGRIKINPLAHWERHDIEDYMVENRLPRHPLVSRGYPSIGCAPCTSAVKPGEDARAGRWRGRDKEECGIHFINGRLVRGTGIQESAA
jgi:phosphoadenosine phosphosulfate reductase